MIRASQQSGAGLLAFVQACVFTTALSAGACLVVGIAASNREPGAGAGEILLSSRPDLEEAKNE